VQDLASITAADFINPTLGGGSLLDHDSGSGLGEPLNVSFLSSPTPPPPFATSFLTTPRNR
jgi:hypothetical protein